MIDITTGTIRNAHSSSVTSHWPAESSVRDDRRGCVRRRVDGADGGADGGLAVSVTEFIGVSSYGLIAELRGTCSMRLACTHRHVGTCAMHSLRQPSRWHYVPTPARATSRGRAP